MNPRSTLRVAVVLAFFLSVNFYVWSLLDEGEKSLRPLEASLAGRSHLLLGKSCHDAEKTHQLCIIARTYAAHARLVDPFLHGILSQNPNSIEPR